MIQNNSEETKKLNIAIVQAFDQNIRDYAEYSRLINAMYAHEKGYTYICFEDDLVPTSVSVFYNKISSVVTVVNDQKNFDWVFYLDSDAIVTNFSYTIEEIIARHPGKEIIIPQDINGKSTGVFILKNTPKMLEVFQKAYEDRTFYHTQTPDQTALFYYLQQVDYASLVGEEPAAFLNAYYDFYNTRIVNGKKPKFWDETSFILHVFCVSAADRANIFRYHLAKKNILCVAKQPEPARFSIPPVIVGNYQNKN